MGYLDHSNVVDSVLELFRPHFGKTRASSEHAKNMQFNMSDVFRPHAGAIPGYAIGQGWCVFHVLCVSLHVLLQGVLLHHS